MYALELRRSVGGYACVYVGRTGNVRRRVQEHARGCSRSAGWVRRHGGVKKRRALMIGLGAHEKPESWEEKETVAAMLAHPHGFACVRGWEFVDDLQQLPSALVEMERDTRDDRPGSRCYGPQLSQAMSPYLFSDGRGYGDRLLATTEAILGRAGVASPATVGSRAD